MLRLASVVGCVLLRKQDTSYKTEEARGKKQEARGKTQHTTEARSQKQDVDTTDTVQGLQFSP
jgi:hypothetical protein